MHEHGPDELSGPVRGSAAWWRALEPGKEAEQADPSSQPTAVEPEKKPRKRRRPTIRTELVERIRQEIAEGTYDTEEKWDAALDRLLEQLGPES